MVAISLAATCSGGASDNDDLVDHGCRFESFELDPDGFRNLTVISEEDRVMLGTHITI
jgi:hypothetical protein